MGEAQALPTCINGEETKGENTNEISNFSHQKTLPWLKRYKWWLQVAIYSLLILSGSSVGTILGRLYYTKGGKSKWLSALVQIAGFPVLLPFFCIPKTKSMNVTRDREPRSSLVLASVYIFLGLFLAATCILFSIGLMYLPVTTYAMILASQLGFNAIFSYFLNAQKFTPYIINSVVLLTSSATLLVFQTDSGGSSKASRKKYVIGFVCTLLASAGSALMLLISQLAFQKIIKKVSFNQVVNLAFFQNLVASVAILIGLFVSGEWKRLNKEMKEFEMGKVSYVMNLFWTAVSWQVCTVGSFGLIFKVSSLFANVMAMFGLPITPILAVIIFNDTITGMKVVAMVLAMWGSFSYIYQHYLDDLQTKTANSSEISEVSMVEHG